VPSQQLQDQLDKKNSVDTGDYVTDKQKQKGGKKKAIGLV
jgi:hypothetical protein